MKERKKITGHQQNADQMYGGLLALFHLCLASVLSGPSIFKRNEASQELFFLVTVHLRGFSKPPSKYIEMMNAFIVLQTDTLAWGEKKRFEL